MRQDGIKNEIIHILFLWPIMVLTASCGMGYDYYYKGSLETWIGAPFDELWAAWISPSIPIELDIYTYDDGSESVRFTISRQVFYQAETMYDPVKNDWVEVTPASAVWHDCETTIKVDVNGIIADIWPGSYDCVSVPSPPRWTGPLVEPAPSQSFTSSTEAAGNKR